MKGNSFFSFFQLLNVSYLRVSPKYFDETVAFMKQTWEQDFYLLVPSATTFLDDDLMLQYENERQLSKAIGVFSMLSIFIACLGLLGLVSFWDRTEEEGSRDSKGTRCIRNQYHRR